MEITVNEIKIRSITFTIDDEGVMNWTINNELFSQSNELISRQILSSESDDETLKLDIPPEVMRNAQAIFATTLPLCNDRVADRHGGRRSN